MQEAKNYRVFGLCRSGNHAIIYWLINKFNNRVTYDNNRAFNINKKGFVNTEVVRKYGEDNLKLDANIQSFEDYDMKKYFSEFEKTLPNVPHENIFIVRDPFNLFASRNKKAQESNYRRLKVIDHTVKLWKIIVKEAYGETNLTDNKLVINFNSWVSDDNYREELSLKMGLPLDKDNINIISPDGGGSSFDRFKYKNSPQEMKVLDRWKHFQNDKQFMSIFEDKELVKLSKKYFKGKSYGNIYI